MRDIFFAASPELVENVLRILRQHGATFVNHEPDRAGNLVINKVDTEMKGNSLGLYIFEVLQPAIELLVESVITESGDKKFFIKQRYGSPYIDLNFINPTFDGEYMVVGHGEMATYPFYYDISTNGKIVPSHRLLELFKIAEAYIRKESRVCRSRTEPKRFLVEKRLYHGDDGAWHNYRIPADAPPN